MDFSNDLSFAQACLQGDADALQKLGGLCKNEIKAFLMRMGASETEALELAVSLFSDCVVSACGPARLERYGGKCALLSWLKTLAANRFVDLKRCDNRRAKLLDDRVQEITPGKTVATGACTGVMSILRKALLEALTSCNAEEAVLLQLIYLHGLTQREIAGYWGCSESSISRLLEGAKAQIAAETLRQIQRMDALLEVNWNDFVDLCQGAEGTLLSHDKGR